ncbi:MAG: histidine kinase [Myxococcales bacterium]
MATRVLHVEDEPLHRDLVADALRREGGDFVLVVAEGRRQLVERLTFGSYDVVLTDFRLPDLDGFEVLDLVRQALGDVPVIMVSSTGSEETVVEALRRGIDDYVVKSPVQLRRLPAIIRAVLERRAEAVSRRRAERALAESERIFRVAIDQFPGAFVIYDAELRYRMVNGYSRRGMGRELSQILGTTDRDHLPPEVVEQVLPALERARDTGEPQSCEIHVHLPEGEFFFEASYRPIRDGEGRVEMILCTTHDVTDRRHAAARLAQSAKDMQSLIEASPVGIIALDPSGRVTVWNDAARSIFGWSREEVLGRQPPCVPSPLQCATEDECCVFAGPAGAEHRWQRKGGFGVDVAVHTAPLRSESGARTGCLLMVQDVTAKKAAVQECRLLATAVAQVDEGIVISDVDGTIRYANPAFEQMSGWSREELAGQTPRLLRSGRHDAAFYADMWASILGGHTWKGRLTNRRKDGTLFHDATTISPVRGEGGEITAFVGVKRDITAELAAQERLEQASRMESIGLLAGGVAHDFNNLLTAIMSYAELLDGTLDRDDERVEDVAEIRRAATRAAGLTKQLLALARRQVIEPVALDLNASVGDMKIILQRLMGESIEVCLRLEAENAVIWADPAQIEQVILNPAMNARDAMPDGGVFDVATRSARVDPVDAAHLGVRPGPYVVLTVADSGAGMDEATRMRCFEPFFTTKPRGHGTGLGLPTVYGVVAQAGGRVDCASAPGVGTTFSIYLPEHAGAAAARAPSTVARLTGGRGETVLVVDDSDSVRAVVRRTLLAAGFRVLDAAAPDVAFQMVIERTEPIHLLICDVVLPTMNGRELSRRILEVRPGLPVLFISGYAESVIARHGVLDPGVALLSKPFTPATLVERACGMLG